MASGDNGGVHDDMKVLPAPIAPVEPEPGGPSTPAPEDAAVEKGAPGTVEVPPVDVSTDGPPLSKRGETGGEKKAGAEGERGSGDATADRSGPLNWQ